MIAGRVEIYMPTPTPAQEQKATAQPRDRDNRSRLLTKVHKFWIEDVLESAKIDDVWLDLPVGERSSAVEPPIPRELHTPDFGAFKVDSGAQIAEVFRRRGRALLILGAPGSGKTMTLLELAKELLVEAEKGSSKPIPVVLNLASWGEKHPARLDDWLVERLFLEYSVPRKLGARLILDGDLLFLFDGLDEVLETRRDDCVTAINTFWQRGNDWIDNGVVVCSRLEEYETLTTRLHLRDAVVIKPLALEQADEYLAELGKDWNDLRIALKSDSVLSEFATSPLLLNFMAVAYRGIPRAEITRFADSTDQKRRLFDHYVARRLREADAHSHYSNTRARHFLAWLGEQMLRHQQSIFYIEGLQPDWLDTKHQQQQYGLGTRLVFALYFGLVSGLVGVAIGGVTGGAFLGLFSGLVGWLLFGFSGNRVNVVDKLNWSWNKARRQAVNFLISGMIGGLVGGLGLGLGGGLILGIISGLILGLLFGVIILLFVRRQAVAASRGTEPNEDLQNSRRIKWIAGLILRFLGRKYVAMLVRSPDNASSDQRSNQNERRQHLTRIGFMTGVGLLGLQRGLIVGVGFGLFAALVGSLGGGLIGGLRGLFFGGFIGLLFGLDTASIDQRANPNQGIRNSQNNALFGGMYFALGFGLLFGLLNGLNGALSGICFGAVIGGLICGEEAVIKHAVLRRILYHSGTVPLNYAKFLNYCASRHLLRRVGGGFVFRHRMLMEYFAESKW